MVELFKINPKKFVFFQIFDISKIWVQDAKISFTITQYGMRYYLQASLPSSQPNKRPSNRFSINTCGGPSSDGDRSPSRPAALAREKVETTSNSNFRITLLNGQSDGRRRGTLTYRPFLGFLSGLHVRQITTKDRSSNSYFQTSYLFSRYESRSMPLLFSRLSHEHLILFPVSSSFTNPPKCISNANFSLFSLRLFIFEALMFYAF